MVTHDKYCMFYKNETISIGVCVCEEIAAARKEERDNAVERVKEFLSTQSALNFSFSGLIDTIKVKEADDE